MTMHQQIAQALWAAQLSGKPMGSVVQEHANFALDDAYAVQKILASKRLAAGQVRTGYKLGVTAQAGMSVFGISEPVYGQLFGSGAVPNGASLSIGGQCIQPKAESEIGFIIGQDIMALPKDHGALASMIESVVPCFEIAGSRIDGWPKAIQDLVADSASFAAYVMGQGRVSPRDIDLSAIKVSVRKNGQSIAQGSSAECMGNPLNALMWLVKKLVAQGDGLHQGELVLTGTIGGLFPAIPGDHFSASFEGLGSVEVRFV